MNVMSITLQDLAAYQEAEEMATSLEFWPFHDWWWYGKGIGLGDGKHRDSVRRVLRERTSDSRSFMSSEVVYDLLNKLSGRR